MRQLWQAACAVNLNRGVDALSTDTAYLLSQVGSRLGHLDETQFI